MSPVLTTRSGLSSVFRKSTSTRKFRRNGPSQRDRWVSLICTSRNGFPDCDPLTDIIRTLRRIVIQTRRGKVAQAAPQAAAPQPVDHGGLIRDKEWQLCPYLVERLLSTRSSGVRILCRGDRGSMLEPSRRAVPGTARADCWRRLTGSGTGQSGRTLTNGLAP